MSTTLHYIILQNQYNHNTLDTIQTTFCIYLYETAVPTYTIFTKNV